MPSDALRRRDALLAKIRKLRYVATSGRATEAEMLAAAEAARRLETEAGFTEEEIAELPWRWAEAPVDRRIAPWASRAWAGIDRFCDTAGSVMQRPRWHPGTPGHFAIYFGREPDVEVALYLHQVCERAMVGLMREFRETPAYRRKRKPKTRRQASGSYLLGVAIGLAESLIRLAEAEIPPRNPARRQAALDRLKLELERRGMTEHQTKTPKLDRAAEALTGDGFRAGSQVPLSRGMGAPKVRALPAPTLRIQGTLF